MVNFSHDFTRSLSISEGMVAAWDISSGRPILDHGVYVRAHSAVYSPDGRLFGTGSSRGLITLWDTSNGIPLVSSTLR